MALITSYDLEVSNRYKVTLSWTGTASRYVWIVVNGNIIYGPSLITTANKEIEVSVQNYFDLEIHETASGEVIDNPLSQKQTKRPQIVWSFVSGSSKYRGFWKQDRTADEQQILTQNHNDTTTLYSVQLDKNVYKNNGGAWNFFKVDSVDSETFRSSVATEKRLFVGGLPDIPTDVVVSGTSPNIEVTIDA